MRRTGHPMSSHHNRSGSKCLTRQPVLGLQKRTTQTKQSSSIENVFHEDEGEVSWLSPVIPLKTDLKIVIILILSGFLTSKTGKTPAETS